jgi:DNA-binding GntR family transcriptional regulator
MAKTGKEKEDARPVSGPRRAGNSRTPIRHSLAEQTYEAIKERILDQKLPPGTRLNIDALSRELNVSSSPIREALIRLDSERLVISELFSGYSVAPQPKADYLRNLIDFRILLEGECALIGAPKKSSAIIVEMDQAHERMSQAPRIGRRYREYKKFVQADGRFHQALVDSAGNEVYSSLYRSLNAIILQSRLFLKMHSDKNRLNEILLEHDRIMKAFLSGDGEEAKRAVTAHLEGGRRRLLNAGNGHEDAPP